jgi:hypothetical protein
MADLNQIFNWFRTGKTPTEQQFRDTFQSFWHKSEKIPLLNLEGSMAADYAEGESFRTGQLVSFDQLSVRQYFIATEDFTATQPLPDAYVINGTLRTIPGIINVSQVADGENVIRIYGGNTIIYEHHDDDDAARHYSSGVYVVDTGVITVGNEALNVNGCYCLHMFYPCPAEQAIDRWMTYGQIITSDDSVYLVQSPFNLSEWTIPDLVEAGNLLPLGGAAAFVEVAPGLSGQTAAKKGQLVKFSYMGQSHIFVVEDEDATIITNGNLSALLDSLADLVDNNSIRAVTGLLPWTPANNIQMPYFKGEMVDYDDQRYIVTDAIIYATSSNQIPAPPTYPRAGAIALGAETYNTASSLSDFPTDKTLLVVTLSASATVFTPAGGTLLRSMTIIVKNATSAEITQEIPTTGNWISWDGNELVIPANGMAEINILVADKYYIMTKVKNS